jgi:outer membrane lipoprotein-sorting protein
LKKSFPVIFLLILIMSLTPDFCAALSPQGEEQAMGVMSKVTEAYAKVEAYRAETEVNEYREGRIVATKRFLYTFKKPDRLRIDMESPYPGTIIVYPDESGKVTVKLGGLAGFVKLHLSPDSVFLRIRAGQPIDRTDLGLLIRSIIHSLTDLRRGELKVADGDDEQTLIEVVSADHFQTGVVTLYRFFIDKSRWLPVEIEEFTPDGVPKRKVRLRNLRTAIDVPDSYFRINGGNPHRGQSGK